jgi:hypothetical protein
MVTTDTYRARTAKELYRHGVYPPNYMKVADVADAIVGAGDRDTAVRAIRNTAADDFSPVVFVRESNQQAITLGRGSATTINNEIRDWIMQWDESELPPELQ